MSERRRWRPAWNWTTDSDREAEQFGRAVPLVARDERVVEVAVVVAAEDSDQRPPGAVAGQIATGNTAVTATVQFRFGDIPAQVVSAGLVPDYVGVYQFTVLVPAGVPAGDVRARRGVAGKGRCRRRA